MSTYVSDYPGAPFDTVMPAQAQQIALNAAIVILAGFALYGAWRCVKEKTALPLLYLVAGFCTILLEPLCTHMGHAIHPPVGQINLFSVADRAIPWHIALIYSFYFGAVYMFLMPVFTSGRVTSGFVWKAYFTICALAYAIEIVPVHVGLWVYYDKQALWLWKGGMPLFWTFVNAACIFFPMALMKVLWPMLKGAGQLLVIPLSVLGAIMAHFGAGSPFYAATNSAASDLLVNLAGLASVGLALLLMQVCVKLITLPVAVFATAAEAAPATQRAGLRAAGTVVN